MVEIQRFIRLKDSKLFCVSESQIIFKDNVPTLGCFVLVSKDEFVEVSNRTKRYKEDITFEEFNNNFKRVI